MLQSNISYIYLLQSHKSYVLRVFILLTETMHIINITETIHIIVYL